MPRSSWREAFEPVGDKVGQYGSFLKDEPLPIEKAKRGAWLVGFNIPCKVSQHLEGCYAIYILCIFMRW